MIVKRDKKKFNSGITFLEFLELVYTKFAFSADCY